MKEERADPMTPRMLFKLATSPKCRREGKSKMKDLTPFGSPFGSTPFGSVLWSEKILWESQNIFSDPSWTPHL